MVSRQAPPSTARAPLERRPTGREAQRRRTRRAIVDAARSLIAAGEPEPAVDAIAAAADVSRRTVYVHFPTLDQLVLDATLGALSDAYVDTALDAADAGLGTAGADVHARLDALVDSVLGLADDTLPLGRRILQLTVAQESAPRRGVRRTGWLEAVLEPVRDRLSDEQHARLVSGLSMVIGFEAMIVLRDVRALDAAEEARTVRWAARALVDSVLAEVGG